MGKSKELATLTDDGGTFSGSLSVTGSNFASTTYTGTSVNPTGVYTGLTSDGGFTNNVRDSGYLQFSTNNVERMRIDASGRVTMPYQPAACYHGRTTTSATQALPNASTVLNNGNHLNGTRFTCPVTGMYRVSMNGYTKYSSDYNWVAIRKNGTNVGGETLHWNKAGTTMHIFVCHEVLVQCTSSDYLEVFQHNVNSVAADIIDRHFVTFELLG